jgi:hypothetical protein
MLRHYRPRSYSHGHFRDQPTGNLKAGKARDLLFSALRPKRKHECCLLLGHSSVQSVCELMFRRNYLVTCHTLASYSADFSNLEGDTFLRNVASLTDYTTLYPRRWQHSLLPLRASNLAKENNLVTRSRQKYDVST